MDKTKSDGINCQCRVCQIEQTTKTQPARQAKYKAAKLNAIVPWTNQTEIYKFYRNCPIGYQVDHIVDEHLAHNQIDEDSITSSATN